MRVLVSQDIIEIGEIPAGRKYLGAGTFHEASQITAPGPLNGKVLLRIRTSLEELMHSNFEYVEVYTRSKALGLLVSEVMEQVNPGGTVKTNRVVVDAHGHVLGAIVDKISAGTVKSLSPRDQEMAFRAVIPSLLAFWASRIDSGAYRFAAHGDLNLTNLYWGVGNDGMPRALFSDMGPIPWSGTERQRVPMGLGLFSPTTDRIIFFKYVRGAETNETDLDDAAIEAFLREIAAYPQWTAKATSSALLQFTDLIERGELPLDAHRRAPNEEAFLERIHDALVQAAKDANTAGMAQTAMLLQALAEDLVADDSVRSFRALHALEHFALIEGANTPTATLVIFRAPRPR